MYDTKALAGDNARWPHTQIAFFLGDAKTFAAMTRVHVIEAGKTLGLAEATATRELDRFVKAIPAAAERLIAHIDANVAKDVATSPDADAARAHIAGEMRMLRAAKHIVLDGMARQLN